MSQPPAASDRTLDVFNVRDYGATGDGQTLDSPAIERAIHACAQAGGGTVAVGPGRYRCGPMALKSGVRLHLAHAAVIQASDRVEDFRVGRKRRGLFFASHAADIAIDGDGVIDGGGRFFHFADRPHFKPDFTRDQTRQGPAYMTRREELVHGPLDFDEKPATMLMFRDCDNLTLRGITLRDAPTWATSILRCRHVNLHDLVIDNDLNIPNSDGLHVTACQNVRIANCDITAGDDAIAITTLNADRKVPDNYPLDRQATRNVAVSNCVLRSRSAAVRIGYGPWDVQRVVLSNLVIHGSNRGIGVFTRNGGSVRDVLCQNVAIETDLVTGHWWGNAEPIHISAVIGEDQNRTIPDDLTSPGEIENVRFVNVTARSPHGCLVLAEQPGLIRDLLFDQVSLRIQSSRWQHAYGGNFDLRPIRDLDRAIYAHDIPASYFKHVAGLRIRDLDVRWGDGLADWHTHALHAQSCRDVRIDGLHGSARDPQAAPVALQQCEQVTVRTFGQSAATVQADPACRDCRVIES